MGRSPVREERALSLSKTWNVAKLCSKISSSWRMSSRFSVTFGVLCHGRRWRRLRLLRQLRGRDKQLRSVDAGQRRKSAATFDQTRPSAEADARSKEPIAAVGENFRFVHVSLPLLTV